MNIEIKPEETGGEIYIPPSKSISHRAIIAASLANGTSRIDHVLLSEDIKATIEAVRAYQAKVVIEQENEDGLFTLFVTGNPEPETRDQLINCEESGSTLRFILPVIALNSKNSVLIGQGRLIKRPLDEYIKILESQNFSIEKGDDTLPLVLEGMLKPGEFELKGNVSSQFITGLFFALPLLDGNSTVKLTTKLESKPYIDLTIKVLNEFGIEIEKISEKEYFIEGNQNYRPTRISVKGDFSQAAFWFVNGIINKKTILKNLSENSLQGDFQIVSILNDSGALLTYEKETGWISKPAHLKGFKVDASDIPDLVPILSIAGALAEGETEIKNIHRLKLKESDRVESTKAMLKAFGVEVLDLEDGFLIKGQNSFNKTTIDSFNDHRIALAAAIASGRADGEVIITDAQCVNKSYPNFWSDFREAGGCFNELDLGTES